MFSGIIENKGIVKEFKKVKDYILIIDTDIKYEDIKKEAPFAAMEFV